MEVDTATDTPLSFDQPSSGKQELRTQVFKAPVPHGILEGSILHSVCGYTVNIRFHKIQDYQYSPPLEAIRC